MAHLLSLYEKIIIITITLLQLNKTAKKYGKVELRYSLKQKHLQKYKSL